MRYWVGAKSQDRTGDPAIFSRVLYQLSYLGRIRRQEIVLLVGDDGLEPPTFCV
jgi:hypothetical protein